MRNAFSFVEVLASLAILSFMGMALIKFNAFNKRAMERNLLKQESILLTNGILYEKEIDNDKVIELFDLYKFNKLHDDDREFLQSIELKASKEIDDRLYLANTSEEELSIEYGTLSISFKEITLNYLWAQKEE